MNEYQFSILSNERFVDLGLFQFGQQRCNPGHSFGPAVRNHYLFHYIISGKGTLLADNGKGENNTFQLRGGEGFMVFPGQINTYWADINNPWEYEWVEFDGIRVKEMLDAVGFSITNPVYTARDMELRSRMEQEMAYIVAHERETSIHLTGHLYLFLDFLVKSIVPERKPKRLKYKDYYIQEALSYIEENYEHDVSVEEIAESIGIDRSYFGKIFKSSLGETPQSYMLKFRMVKATELLRLTNMSISDISAAVGYSDYTHFSRAFRSIYGMSPREWRKTN